MAPKLTRMRADLRVSLIAASLPTAALLARLGLPLGWPALLLPLSVFALTFALSHWITRHLSRLATLTLGLCIGAVMVHLALWLPFLLASYLGGQGIGRLEHALPAALFTALAVTWYILIAYLPVTIALCLLIGALILFARKHHRSL